jgi:hypothetical protein
MCEIGVICVRGVSGLGDASLFLRTVVAEIA